jgi:hypothetical protein
MNPFSEMEEVAMKSKNETRLEVVALESRELLSTVIPGRELNHKAAADVVRFDPTEGTASAGVVRLREQGRHAGGQNAAILLIPVASPVNDANARSREIFAKRLEHKPDIPCVVIPNAVTAAPSCVTPLIPVASPVNDANARSREIFAKRLEHKPDIPFVVIPNAATEAPSGVVSSLRITTPPANR